MYTCVLSVLCLLRSATLFIRKESYRYLTHASLRNDSFFLTDTRGVCMRSISSYSVQMRENTDQNNFEYGFFSRSGYPIRKLKKIARNLSHLCETWSVDFEYYSEKTVCACPDNFHTQISKIEDAFDNICHITFKKTPNHF